MRRYLYFLCLALLSLSFYGCMQNEVDFGSAENEIFSYEKPEQGKIQLTVARVGNINIDNICEAFEKENPDVQITVMDITGGTGSSQPYIDWIKYGPRPDIMFMATSYFTQVSTKDYFVDLSVEPMLENFQTEALNKVAMEGKIFFLPGPSNIDCIAYNKTLFDKYKWKTPTDFDEFVELCVQINKDTNGEIEAWNPNAKYDNEITGAIEAFTYAELFGGAANREWYNNFMLGKATFKGHMEPFYEVVEKLLKKGVVRKEHFTYSATTRWNEFSLGKIAMVNCHMSNLFTNSEYEFSIIPFPSTTGGTGYLLGSFSCGVGMTIKDNRSEKTKNAAKDFLEFFATPKAQEVFIGNTLMSSNVKGCTLTEAEKFSAVQEAVDMGNVFTRLEFACEGKRVNFSLYQDIKAMVESNESAEKLISRIDSKPYVEITQNTKPVEVVAVAEQDFTVLEVSNYFADMYREKANADIALIANNLAFRGNLMRIYKGDITLSDVTTLKPRSFENNSTLVKVKMTGKQLLEALNKPINYSDGTANCIYAYSGLKCTVAPWNALGEKMISVTLYDGTPIEEAKEYTVAIWEGTVFEEYITEVMESYEGTFEKLLEERLREDKVISPENDGRIKLVWE